MEATNALLRVPLREVASEPRPRIRNVKRTVITPPAIGCDDHSPQLTQETLALKCSLECIVQLLAPYSSYDDIQQLRRTHELTDPFISCPSPFDTECYNKSHFSCDSTSGPFKQHNRFDSCRLLLDLHCQYYR